MGLSAVELGLDLSGIGPVARGGKFAIKGTFRGIGKVASEVKPLASGAIDVAKTKAGKAYSLAKSTAGDAATWMSETSDSVVGGLTGAANWMYSGAAGFFGRGRRVSPTKPSNYTKMQDYIPELGKLSLSANTRLTQQQVFALYENLQAVVNKSLPGYRQLIASGKPRAEVLKGLQSQMNLPRWRFIDQVPGGRDAIQGILREFPEISFPY